MTDGVHRYWQMNAPKQLFRKDKRCSIDWSEPAMFFWLAFVNARKTGSPLWEPGKQSAVMHACGLSFCWSGNPGTNHACDTPSLVCVTHASELSTLFSESFNDTVFEWITDSSKTSLSYSGHACATGSSWLINRTKAHHRARIEREKQTQ